MHTLRFRIPSLGISAVRHCDFSGYQREFFGRCELVKAGLLDY